MSLYREAGRRSAIPIMIAAVTCGLLGGLVGYAIGSGGEEDEPSLSEAVAGVQDDVQPALSELELVQIEYTEAVRGGRIIADTEYQASVEHGQRAQEALEGVTRELELLDPAASDQASEALSTLSTLVSRRAAPSAVTEQVGVAELAVRRAARL